MADDEALKKTIDADVPSLAYPIAVDKHGDPIDPTTVIQIRLPRAGEPANVGSIFRPEGDHGEKLYSITVQEQLEMLYRQGFRGRLILSLHGEHRLAEKEKQNAASRLESYPRTDCSICTAFITANDRMRGYKLLELRHAGQAGCSACSALYQGITHFAEMLELEYEDWESNVRQKPEISKLLSETSKINVEFSLNDEQIAELEFSCTGSPCSASPSEAPIPRIADTSSNATIDLVRNWLDTCTAEHDECTIRARTPLPSQLVDVSNYRVKLVDTEGKEGVYLALSHCWGRNQIVQTKLENIEQRRKDIPWELLSKTFQDAIIFTWKLGYRYIWIDSLCIIQDSRKDWEIQVSQMSKIFSRAQLTISATHATDGNQGCFSIRTTEPFEYRYQGVTVEETNLPAIWEDFGIKAKDRDGVDKNLSVRVKPKHGIQHNPLLQRAWVYQEQVLSPRILHFASGELYFECKSYVCCECMGWEKRSESLQLETRRRKAHGQLVKLKPSLRRPSMMSKEEQTNRDFEAYRLLIEEYTNTHITNEHDRLPALSGISFGRQDEYLAGMWKSILVQSLHWKSTRSVGHAMARRPYTYRAPSWSWAAIEAPVKHIGEFSADYHNDIYNKAEIVADIVFASCTSEGVDARGRVSRGYIKIRGQVVRCRCTTIRVREDPGYHESDSCAELRLGNLVDECELDIPLSLARQSPTEIAPAQDVDLLRISKRVALVLNAMEDVPGAYRRVGIAWIDKADRWFEGIEKVSIFIL